MTIKFEQTIDDVVALGLYNKKHISIARKIVSFVPIAVLSIILLVTLYYYVFFRELVIFGTKGVVFVALMVFYAVLRTNWYYRLASKRKYNRIEYASWYGDRTLTFSESSLFTKTATAETHYNWDSFTKFGETNHYFFLFISKIQAVVIPKRIFLLPQEEHDIKSFIERKLSEHKS